MTKDYIIGLEVVLPTGELMQTGVRTEKGVVGYDLTRLFIGSEGTLGIFTKLTVRLLPLPESRLTYLLTFSSLNKATETVARILAAGLIPCTLEYMDKTAIQVVRNHVTLDLAAGTEALLILEIDGSGREVKEQEEKLTSFLKETAIEYTRASDDTERKEIWTARRSISPATFSLKPDKIGEDIVVPRSKIPDLVAFTEQLARELDLTILTFGHAGDGNIHVNIMIDRADETERDKGQTAKKRLFEQVVGLGGTLSGEHGIGITKSSYLPIEISETALTVMKKLKQLFDPNNILNPGKIFPD